MWAPIKYFFQSCTQVFVSVVTDIDFFREIEVPQKKLQNNKFSKTNFWVRNKNILFFHFIYLKIFDYFFLIITVYYLLFDTIR